MLTKAPSGPPGFGAPYFQLPRSQPFFLWALVVPSVRRPILIPTPLVDPTDRVMKEFAGAERLVSSVMEGCVQANQTLVQLPVNVIVVEPGGGRILTGEDRRSRRTAFDASGMSVGELHPASGQRIDIGRDGLAVPTNSPIVHVIDGDEQDIGLRGHQSGQRCEGKRQHQGCYFVR